MSRVKILVGHTGSGKSEIALNLAIKEATQGNKVALVDLDIVNPYFCIREHSNFLKESFGISVISSISTLRNAELMVIPKEVTSYILNPAYSVIIDVGGDEDGAKVLKQYENYLKSVQYECYFVVNPFRANTTSMQEIIEFINNIEMSSKIRITHILNNSNLLKNTTNENLLYGYNLINELSRRINIPIKYNIVHEKFHNDQNIHSVDNVFLIKSYINIF